MKIGFAGFRHDHIFVLYEKAKNHKLFYIIHTIINNKLFQTTNTLCYFNNYNTYYKWSSDDTSSYNVIMELPDGNIDEVPEFMPSVIEIGDVEGGGDYFNLKHFYGINDYVSYNDIKSPFIIQTGRLCRVDYLNNTTSFISDNPSDAVNNCLEATPDGVFIDTNGIIYKVNSDNTFSPVFSGALNVTEGFFVNFASAGAKTITFNKNQRYTGNAKALVQRELVKLTMIDGENESELFFACNEEAKQGS